MRKLGDGMYAGDDGALHVDVPELLVANGVDDTPENRDLVARMAADCFEQLGIAAEIK